MRRSRRPRGLLAEEHAARRSMLTNEENEAADSAKAHARTAAAGIESAESEKNLPACIKRVSNAEGHFLQAAGDLRGIVNSATERVFPDEQPKPAGGR
jgi:hypothetical protein